MPKMISFSESELGTKLFQTMLKMDRAVLLETIRNAFSAATAPIGRQKLEPVQVLQKSVDIGTTGEKMVKSVLQQEYTVEVVSGKPYSGDLMLYRPRKYGDGTVNIMVEVKNYSSTVPTAEVEKFQRDVAVMPNIHAAMMLSLGSPIAGHSMLDIADLTNGRHVPIMYLTSDCPEIILASMRLLHAHVDQYRSICGYLELYNQHLYPKIWKQATKALELLQGIAQTRVLLLELRTQMCQKIDRIQERILVNETQLTIALEKIRHRVSEFVPDSITGGRKVRADNLWSCIEELVREHANGSALCRMRTNLTTVQERVSACIQMPEGDMLVQLHGRVLMVSQVVPIFRLKLLMDSTELGYPPRFNAEGSVQLTSMQTYDGNWIMERVGRKGNLLHPRTPSLKPITAQSEWKPGDMVADMLPDEMPNEDES